MADKIMACVKNANYNCVHACMKYFLFYSSEVLERLQSELEGDCPINFQSPIADDVIHPKDILPNVFEGKFVSEV